MKRGRIKGKGGVSPIIASVLLILLIIVLASMVFLWARGFISEQIEKFDKPIDQVCEGVEFDVELFGSGGNQRLEVVNRKDVDIYNLQIKKVLGGNSEVSTFKVKIDARSSASGSFNFNLKGGQTAEEVIITPTLIGTEVGKDSKRVFTCVDKSIKRTINF
tara:strand:+ start:284 stop:766 length:483 start_codon:yes stop_codon:yes gene_type:complete